MEIILAVVWFMIAIAAGTSLPLWLNVIAGVALLIWSGKTMGFEQIFTVIVSGIFIAGLIVGNISYAFQSNYFDSLDMGNPFVVEKKIQKEAI